MRNVVVLGIGQSRFGKFPDLTATELGTEAAVAAIRDAGIDPRKIQVAYGARAVDGSTTVQDVMKNAGVTEIEMNNIENACASGVTAVNLLYRDIASGAYDVGIAVGMEAMTTSSVAGKLLGANKDDINGQLGMSMPGYFALMTRRFMKATGATAEDMAYPSWKNHLNGCLNPYSMYKKKFSIGSVANAVGYELKNRNDLGAHTELVGDAIMYLMKRGVLTNRRKSFLPGKTVTAFSLGSKELYDYVDHNESLYYLPFHIVNDCVNIAKNDHMISINTAMSIDLFGQVNADNIAGRQHSAIGGQLDFVRGAQMSKGGKSFIAITSTYNDKKAGRASRIVSHFPLGTCVTTPRSDVQYVATEFGCVNLKELTMKDRVRAMISLAHPDFRPQLMDEARQSGIL